MNRSERRHIQPKKKNWILWIVIAIIIIAGVAFFTYQYTKGTGVDYTQYAYTDDSFAAPNATIIIEEFSDFECPFCQDFASIIRVVRDTHSNVRIVFKQFPLRSIHPDAELAAEATECSREQGKFWAYHDVAFESKLLDKRSLKLHAEGLGLDMKQWQSCMDLGRTATKITSDLLEGQQRGVRGTPTLYVNGILFSGRTVADFEALINKQ